jgi:hypothetical protein
VSAYAFGGVPVVHTKSAPARAANSARGKLGRDLDIYLTPQDNLQCTDCRTSTTSKLADAVPSKGTSRATPPIWPDGPARRIRLAKYNTGVLP